MIPRLERVVRQTLDDRFSSTTDLAAAIVAAVLGELRESRAITTVEQLDALPAGSVVLAHPQDFQDFNGIKVIPGVFHRFPEPCDGWYVVAGHGPREPSSVDLPALLLWHPSWAGEQR